MHVVCKTESQAEYGPKTMTKVRLFASVKDKLNLKAGCIKQVKVRSENPRA